VCYCIGRDKFTQSCVQVPALLSPSLRANPYLRIDEAYSWVFSGSHTLGLPHRPFREATHVVFEANCVVDTYPF
jgi:hypothetical protein